MASQQEVRPQEEDTPMAAQQEVKLQEDTPMAAQQEVRPQEDTATAAQQEVRPQEDTATATQQEVRPQEDTATAAEQEVKPQEDTPMAAQQEVRPQEDTPMVAQQEVSQEDTPMASKQDVRQEETPMDREMGDQTYSTETLGENTPPKQQVPEENNQRQDADALPAPAVESINNYGQDAEAVPAAAVSTKNQRQDAEAAPAAVESTDNQTKQQGGTPPFPYQQQPLEEQTSSDYAPYAKFTEEESHQQQQEVQRKERWGTPLDMGAPAKPDAHPDNQNAAAGEMMDTKDPSVQDSTPHVSAGKFSFAGVKEVWERIELAVNHLWGHLTTGSSVHHTAIGRLSAGTRILTHGGYEGVFREAFNSDKNETLKKAYACFLSTTTGPVAGTLYISNKRLAFCSDRPLRYTPAVEAPAEVQWNPAKVDAPAANGEGGDKSRYSYYKVAIPIEKIREIVPSMNPNKLAEKYIEVIEADNLEFWFMGFVHYDKGIKNLQEAVSPRA